MTAAGSELLCTKELCINFGGLKAVENFCIDVRQGEIVGLIGPNGAGKTTCFNMITGVYKPTSGSVTLGGERIDGKATPTINRMGIARTFQNIRLFRELSVLDNVRIALHAEVKYGLWAGIFRTGQYHRDEDKLRQRLEK